MPPARRALARAFVRPRTCSRGARPRAAAWRELAGRKAVTLAAGVDPERVRAAVERRSSVRAELGLADDEWLILYAGRLADDKGVDLAIRALPSLSQARLVICGEGPATPARGPRIAPGRWRTLAGSDSWMTRCRSWRRPIQRYCSRQARARGGRCPLSRPPRWGLRRRRRQLGGDAELAAEGIARLAPTVEPGVIARGLEAAAAQPRQAKPMPLVGPHRGAVSQRDRRGLGRQANPRSGAATSSASAAPIGSQAVDEPAPFDVPAGRGEPDPLRGVARLAASSLASSDLRRMAQRIDKTLASLRAVAGALCQIATRDSPPAGCSVGSTAVQCAGPSPEPPSGSGS